MALVRKESRYRWASQQRLRPARRSAGRPALAGLVALILNVVFALPAQAEAGDLDPTFGSDGKVTTDFGFALDRANGVTIQPDGRIIAAGSTFQAGPGFDFALARYNTDGTLDASFGSDGTVTTDFGSSEDLALGVAIQPNGKIVAAGFSRQAGTFEDIALARYNRDGTLDASFGSDGPVTSDFGSSNDQAAGVAIQPNGRIVAAGSSTQAGTFDFALARYNPDGTLDASFGSGGKVTTDFGSSSDTGTGVAIQHNGAIVVAGSSNQAGTGFDFALAQYNTDGTLDASFGSGGKVTTDFGSSNDQAAGVAIQPNDKIVAAGQSLQPGPTGDDFALARYNPDGTLDASFGSGGKVTTDFGSSLDRAQGVAIQSNGRIVAAGLSNQAGTFDFALARYNPDGTLDASFGSGGKVTTDFGSTLDLANGVAIQPHGRIVAAGLSNQAGTGFDFALARYFGR
jgi:uncharacterized delta-60 repeat protein